jgi:hypothetical protein
LKEAVNLSLDTSFNGEHNLENANKQAGGVVKCNRKREVNKKFPFSSLSICKHGLDI